MSRYIYVVSPSAKRLLCLGKGLYRVDGETQQLVSVGLFGDSDQHDLLRKAVVQFLVDSAGGPIEILADYELEQRPELEDCIEIGGDSVGDISLYDYLRAAENTGLGGAAR